MCLVVVDAVKRFSIVDEFTVYRVPTVSKGKNISVDWLEVQNAIVYPNACQTLCLTSHNVMWDSFR